MSESQNDVREGVYEIGYLIVSSVPAEKIGAEAEAIKSIITKSGAKVIAEELPHEERLAYTMRKKTVSGSYDKYDTAHFGWVKFESASEKVEDIKKTIEAYPSVLRMLMVSTVKENTYLGKHAPAFAENFAPMGRRMTERAPMATRIEPAKVVAPASPASVEEMDKSIDAMVKEA
jgi:ribosomal protein S6